MKRIQSTLLLALRLALLVLFCSTCLLPPSALANEIPSTNCKASSTQECTINDSSDDEEDSSDDYDYEEEESDPNACTLYLARSTIPNSGLGVFTGIPHPRGSIIAPPEIAIQLLVTFDDDKTTQFTEYAKLVQEYTWSSFVTGAYWESRHLETLIPGLGMAANSFLPLVNAESVMGSIDSGGVNTNTMGPGSGAFSSFHDTIYTAERSIRTGSEVFVNYGDGYFRNRPNKFGMVPLESEFREADGMLDELWDVLQKTNGIKGLLTEGGGVEEELQKVWNVIRNNFVSDERVRNALPESISDLERASIHGTPYNFLRGENPRSLDWLQSNGYCMDTLHIRPSSIPHAGRGAFAKRSFHEGETILPLPLLQMERKALNIIHGQNFISHQLILNYSFGHKDSSLLLYPYSSSANFVNHGGKEANAKVVWANNDRTRFHNKDWLSIPPGDLMRKDHTGLLMLLVATRDIDQDEEVLIDYGDDWQKAWDEHVTYWSSEVMPNIQRSAAELNESEKQIRTIFEEQYPFMTVCHYLYDAQNAHDDPPEQDGDDLESKRRLLPWIEEHATTWRDLGGRTTMSGNNLRPCFVYARHTDDEESTYTVRMMNRGGGHEADPIPEDKPHYVKGVERRAILFVDSSYTSTQQNSNAFRHEIGFPDGDMWPQVWKNLIQR